jgi:ABC-type branched-subunit amino acid transport system substrate-binding protein
MRIGCSKRRVVVSLIVGVLAVASIGIAAPAGAQKAKVPGVTKDQITVCGVAGVTNPTGVPYQDGFAGIQGYFQKINKEGGVFGRQLKLVGKYDDQTRDSKNIQAVRACIEDDKAFAVAPMVTQTFAGAKYLVDNGVPTFGWNIQEQWKLGPNLFGEKGSFLCMTCPNLTPVFIAQAQGSHKAAAFGYGSSPQSADCANNIKSSFEKWNFPFAFTDTSLAFGFSANDTSAIVQAIKDQGVDFITACIDLNGEVNLQKALKAAGVNNVKFWAPQGYDQQNLDKLGADLNGFNFIVPFVPFELAKGNKEMSAFLASMKKAGQAATEQALAGWQNGALLVAGIKAAGKNFTRESVISSINKMTNWTANGLRPKINWTNSGHTASVPGDQACYGYVQVENGKFVPQFKTTPQQPFVCFGVNPYPATLTNPTLTAATP